MWRSRRVAQGSNSEARAVTARWAKVPVRVATERSLSKDAMRLFVVLSSYADGQTRFAFPSQETVCVELGWVTKTEDPDRRRFYKAMQRLLVADFVRRAGTQSHGSGAWTYRYVVAPFPSDADVMDASDDADPPPASSLRTMATDAYTAADDAVEAYQADALEAYDVDAWSFAAQTDQQQTRKQSSWHEQIEPRSLRETRRSIETPGADDLDLYRCTNRACDLQRVAPRGLVGSKCPDCKVGLLVLELLPKAPEVATTSGVADVALFQGQRENSSDAEPGWHRLQRQAGEEPETDEAAALERVQATLGALGASR